ncbi:MAG TPA: ammonium transporter [Dehalococcoidia bacterium]|nr:ammonium transporter [Dehalococcoidia bacterium]
MSSGDTAWILISSALVMLMTPGVALFYGGMVRRKNVLSTLMMSFAALGLVGLLWILYGYSLSFGPDIGGLLGRLDFIGLRGVGQEPSPVYASTVPHLAFMVFQGMFAIITVALITGAVVERIKFSSLLLFSALWLTFVYAPVAHWVWGDGGWLAELGALDFAGGTVVHICAGVSALALALVLGPRKGFRDGQPMEPHNIPMVMLGAGLLWFGWFGFNAGSALTSGGLAASAFVATNASAAAAAFTWMVLDWIYRRPTMLGTATGAVAGLVAITPAAGFVSPMMGIPIGMGAAVVCYYCMLFRMRRQIDESLDVWAVHGMGGTWGAIATGVFASVAVNSAGANGLLMGNVLQLGKQMAGVAAVWLFAFGATWVLAKLVEVTLGVRVSGMEETVGLDIAQHGERAYGGALR